MVITLKMFSCDIICLFREIETRSSAEGRWCWRFEDREKAWNNYLSVYKSEWTRKTDCWARVLFRLAIMK